MGAGRRPTNAISFVFSNISDLFLPGNTRFFETVCENRWARNCTTSTGLLISIIVWKVICFHNYDCLLNKKPIEKITLVEAIIVFHIQNKWNIWAMSKSYEFIEKVHKLAENLIEIACFRRGADLPVSSCRRPFHHKCNFLYVFDNFRALFEQSHMLSYTELICQPQELNFP